MMKKWVFTLLLVALCPASFCSSGRGAVAIAQQSSRRVVSLHPALGTVVTAELNTRYNLFGGVPNFLAAKLYEKPDGGFELRLMTSEQMIIKQLSMDEGRRLQQSIARRLASTEPTAVLAPAYPLAVPAANASGMVKVVLDDETVLTGQIKFVTADTVSLLTPSGIYIALPEAKIREVHISRLQLRAGKYYRADPNSTRLLFAPTGRGLRAGQGYFADYWIFFPTLAIGFSDFFGVGAGMSIFPGASSQLLYIAPKISFAPSESFAIATGFLHLGIPEADDLTLGYGVVTVGSSQAALTGGFGVPLTEDNQDFIFLLGGELQTSNSTKLITENWIPSDGDAAISLGVRFFGESIAVDLAFITAKSILEDIEGWPFIPWVDFAVNFGH